jgi:hypothetical protein
MQELALLVFAQVGRAHIAVLLDSSGWVVVVSTPARMRAAHAARGCVLLVFFFFGNAALEHAKTGASYAAVWMRERVLLVPAQMALGHYAVLHDFVRSIVAAAGMRATLAWHHTVFFVLARRPCPLFEQGTRRRAQTMAGSVHFVRRLVTESDTPGELHSTVREAAAGVPAFDTLLVLEPDELRAHRCTLRVFGEALLVEPQEVFGHSLLAAARVPAGGAGLEGGLHSCARNHRHTDTESYEQELFSCVLVLVLVLVRGSVAAWQRGRVRTTQAGPRRSLGP